MSKIIYYNDLLRAFLSRRLTILNLFFIVLIWVISFSGPFITLSLALSLQESHPPQDSGLSRSSAPYVSNEVLVQFYDGVAEEEKEAIRRSIGALLIKTISSIRVEHWRLPQDVSTEESLIILRTHPVVEYAEPNFLNKPHLRPNDSFFDRQWFLQNTGQSINGISGLPGADIAATSAWDMSTGSSEIVIAVIDSGVAFDHPDLTDNVWVNRNEIPDNGLDDDNNGYIDDLNGWDFVNNDNSPLDYSSDAYGDGHGTHVAGIVAARGNNGIGTTGIMWQAQIMSLQVFDLYQRSSFYEASIQSARIISAIEYATNNGAKIINLSLGGPTYKQFEYDIIQYAREKGVLVVAAAGNAGLNNDLAATYPASYNLDNIISVAATNEFDSLAFYSNYGQTSVDVAAPGGSDWHPNIYSISPPERESLFYEDFEGGLGQWFSTGKYEPWSVAYDPYFGSNVAVSSISTYRENENSYLETVNPIISENCRGLYLSFKIYYELEEDYDFVYIEQSMDGINYVPEYYATGFSFGVIPFSDWSNEFEIGEFYLRFNLETDFSHNYSGVSIDDINITGVPWVYDGSEYGYKSGTSMAAPVVSGVAGLLWAVDSELTYLEIKNTILESVDELETLTGKILSGGRINAYKALLLAQSPEKLYGTDSRLSSRPNALSSFSIPGVDPDSQNLYVENSGAGEINYVVNADADWVHLTPDFGTVSENDNIITVDYNVANLGEGVHTATITISYLDIENPPVKIPVTLVIGDREPVYHFRSGDNAHFYTINGDEQYYISNTYPEDVWKYEGIAWYAYLNENQSAGSRPVYRFWSDLYTAHFYTISEDEKEYIIAAYSDFEWKYEGVAYYAYTEGFQPKDAKAVHRFWSEQYSTHLFTMNEIEKESLINNYPGNIWRYEGIAWYAFDESISSD